MRTIKTYRKVGAFYIACEPTLIGVGLSPYSSGKDSLR